MAQSKQKVLEYLGEARACELALARALQAQLAIAPAGDYRSALEQQLTETLAHEERVRDRLTQLGQAGRREAFLSRAAGAFTGLARAPKDRLRGSAAQERMLLNATEVCGTAAVEIATYTALERLARSDADDETADLAAAIVADKEALLRQMFAVIGELTDATIGSGGRSVPEVALGVGTAATTEEAITSEQATRAAGREAREPAVKLPANSYDLLTAEQVIARVDGLSQSELIKLADYERDHQNRPAVLAGIASLEGDEPWPGYDQLNESSVGDSLGDANRERLNTVIIYERAHKNRMSVLQTAAHHLAMGAT